MLPVSRVARVNFDLTLFLCSKIVCGWAFGSDQIPKVFPKVKHGRGLDVLTFDATSLALPSAQ